MLCLRCNQLMLMNKRTGVLKARKMAMVPDYLSMDVEHRTRLWTIAFFSAGMPANPMLGARLHMFIPFAKE